MADPQVKAQVWDQCGCGGEIKKAIFAHPHPLHGCKFKYTVQDFAATIKRVCLDFFIGIHDRSNFAAGDSICFEIHINGEKRWSKQWSKKQWNRNRIGGIKVGPGRTLEVMFVTNDLGRNEHNWAVWGSPALIVEELQIEQVPDIRQKVAHVSRGTVSPIGGKDMDYERGLQALKECLAEADPAIQSELATLEERFRKNQRAERLFGSSENTRNERSQIIFSLNELALKHCGVSFNDLCQGAQPKLSVQPPPTARPEPSTSPPRRERDWVHFKLQIAQLVGLDFKVRALETPMGEPRAAGRLPYDSTDLIAVLKALELGDYTPERFTSAQTEALQRLGLLRNSRLVSDLLPRIGGGLYHALFPEQVGTAFQMALNQARSSRDTVALQLRFDHDAVALARYPWELLHDGHRHLLSGGAVEMTRYITYAQAATALPVAPPWRLLYIGARPQNLDKLPGDTERLAVWNGLQSLAETGKLTLDRLDPPTYDALLDRMAATDYHIIHFDGHGVFARRCPECATMHYPHLTTCQSCATPLDNVPPLGYLAFESSDGDADNVSTEDMENLLLGSEVRLALLSACQSAVVRGGSLFGGLGPGLIRAGVPAVVAMQFSVPVKAAVSFAQGFYTALAQGETVPRAVAQGRRRLFRGKTWFIPTLYLRSTDDEGRLFIEKG